MTPFDENIFVAVVGGLISAGLLTVIILRLLRIRPMAKAKEDLANYYTPDIFKSEDDSTETNTKEGVMDETHHDTVPGGAAGDDASHTESNHS